jgi:hypothetical protein
MPRAKINASDYVPSLIRTYVPIGVGLALSWLSIHFSGVHVDPQTSLWLTGVLTALLTAGYYTLVRALEIKFPALSILLGHTAKPVYLPKTKPSSKASPLDPPGPGGVAGGSDPLVL